MKFISPNSPYQSGHPYRLVLVVMSTPDSQTHIAHCRNQPSPSRRFWGLNASHPSAIAIDGEGPRRGFFADLPPKYPLWLRIRACLRRHAQRIKNALPAFVRREKPFVPILLTEKERVDGTKKLYTCLLEDNGEAPEADTSVSFLDLELTSESLDELGLNGSVVVQEGRRHEETKA